MLSIFDIVLIIILAGFGFYGFFFGFIKTVGSLIGIIAGVFVASRFYQLVFIKIQNWFFGQNTTGKIITFVVLFSLANRLTVFIFSLLDRLFDFISIIPFLKTINRLAGVIFGLLMGVAVLGIAFYFILNYPFIGGWVGKLVSSSKIAPFLIKIGGILTPILPEAFKKVKLM
jgi:membrane protein required for colicin V production